MSEQEPTRSILDLPPRFVGAHSKQSNAQAVLQAAFGKLDGHLRDRLSRLAQTELGDLESKVKNVVQAAIEGSVSAELGLEWDTYRRVWKINNAYNWIPSAKTLQEMIREHASLMIDQLREAIPARRLSEKELDRAEEVYLKAFNKYLPEAIEAEARRAAEQAAQELFAARREVLVQDILAGAAEPAEAK